ncbi:RNA degradosome polyphosphate kinase, partial [Nocardioides sp.]|uniref:RNA degradosome polyphosphate kinase n=1 Tax=Nocardioides sp. TaxID=35761 RepID=UPI002ED9B2D2
MSLESLPPDAVSSHGEGVPEESFEVEPPYQPDHDEIAAVEKYEDRFLDRELSWLRFNQRVLELAEDPALPLLERARFLAIFTSNLDEFFMVRVAGLKRRIAAGVAVPAASGLMPTEVLNLILTTTRELAQRQARVFRDEVVPALADVGIELVRWDDLDREEQKTCKRLFRDRVFPVLTPLAVDPAHPFPYISGLSLNLAVLMRNPRTEKEHFARVKVPPIFARFVPVGNQRFVPLEDVIREHLRRLFPGMDVLEVHTFRVTRNEDLEVEEDDAENILAALEKELLRRRFGPPVRLEVEESIAPQVLDLLMSELGISEEEVFRLRGPLDLRGLHDIADLPRQELKYPAFLPTTHLRLAEVESAAPVDVFKATRRHDVLLHHPYDSFATSVQRFLEQAAADPHVLAIKQTLYRTSGDSPIIDALVDAAEAGKQVLVIVEIKARFDEEANIRWARKLEQAGCHVVYGLVGLKTHCKLSMVVRDEPDGIRRYTHIGTGNYNPKTSRMYEDLGLITTNERIGEDVAHLFNNLSGYSRKASYEELLVAPDSVRTGLVQQIHREIEHARAGKDARIRIKANSIVDEATIDALYRASRAGVPVDLLVRGICAV